MHLDPALGGNDRAWVRSEMERVLAARDTSAQRAGAAHLADVHRRLDDAGRAEFLRLLAGFGVDEDSLLAAARALVTEPSATHRHLAVRLAATPRFAALLHQFTGLDDGVKFLVDLRADLRRLVRREPAMALFDHELAGHLTTLFDVGLLDLERVTWHSPAAVLEKLIEYEAVHEIDGWDDLRNRLDADRRCFAFMHPSMPAEPIVFVEIALVQGPAESLAPLLDRDAPVGDPDEADTAIFYSITSCQAGLAGINLGNELIKQVVHELQRDLPSLKTFMTLSPIPSLRRALTPELRPDIAELLEDDDWPAHPAKARAVEEALMPMAARYLTTPVDGRVPDPVANFHLRNGAAISAIRWMANPSTSGMERSWGMMVNYRYDPARIPGNAEAYADATDVAASDAVRKLLD